MYVGLERTGKWRISNDRKEALKNYSEEWTTKYSENYPKHMWCIKAMSLLLFLFRINILVRRTVTLGFTTTQ
jgi:hypothetical protein